MENGICFEALQSKHKDAENTDEPIERCVVCLESITERAIVTPCHHSFDFICILSWLEESSNCPLCRRDITFSRCKVFQHSDFSQVRPTSQPSNTAGRPQQASKPTPSNPPQTIALQLRSKLQLKLCLAAISHEPGSIPGSPRPRAPSPKPSACAVRFTATASTPCTSARTATRAFASRPRPQTSGVGAKRRRRQSTRGPGSAGSCAFSSLAPLPPSTAPAPVWDPV